MSYTKKGVNCLLPVATAAIGALSAITFTHISNLFAKPESEIKIIQIEKTVEKLVNVSVPYEVDKVIYVDKVVEVEKLIYMDKIINVPIPTPYEVEKIIYVDKIIETPVEVQKVIYVDKIIEQPCLIPPYDPDALENF